MKTLIVYDSVFGHTEKIAQAIGAAASAPVLPVGQVTADAVHGLDVLIVGSPTRSLRPTEAITQFLSRLPKDHLRGVRVAAFDTRWGLESIDSGFVRLVVGKGGYAANAIASALKKKGGKLVASPEGFLVTGIEGPLKDGEIERASTWAADWAKRLFELNQEG